jgi:ribulose kinase
VASSSVKGIGFDATCSLAVVDVDGNPLSISPTGKNSCWCHDFRAVDIPAVLLQVIILSVLHIHSSAPVEMW